MRNFGFKKVFKNVFKSLIVLSTLILLAVSCDDDSATFYYKLTLNATANENGIISRGTTQLYYNPNTKEWFKDINGKEKLTPTTNPIDKPQIRYTATFNTVSETDYPTAAYRPEVTVPPSNVNGEPNFKGYRGFISGDAYILPNASISKDTTIDADWDSVTVELPDVEDGSGVFTFIGWYPLSGSSSKDQNKSENVVKSKRTLTGDETFEGVWSDPDKKELTLIPWSDTKQSTNTYTEIATGDEGKTVIYFKENKSTNTKTWSFDANMLNSIKTVSADDLPKKRWQIKFEHEKSDGQKGVDYPDDSEMNVPIESLNRQISWDFDGYVYTQNTTKKIISAQKESNIITGKIENLLSSSDFTGNKASAVATWKWTGTVDQNGNEIITITAPNAAGWDLKGFLASSGTVTQVGDTNTYTYQIKDATPINGVPTITIRARWETNKVQSVILDHNGATENPYSQTSGDLSDGLFYSTNKQAWYLSQHEASLGGEDGRLDKANPSDPDDKDYKINPPKKVWSIAYNLNNSDVTDVVNETFQNEMNQKKTYEFKFNGYEVRESSSASSASKGYVVTSNSTIPSTWKPSENSQTGYANWTKPERVQLIDPQTIPEVKTATAGWRFTGWKDEATGNVITDLTYNPDDDNENIRDKRVNQVLTAQWEAVKYNVTIDATSADYAGHAASPLMATQYVRMNSKKKGAEDYTEGYLIKLDIDDSLGIEGQDSKAEFDTSNISTKSDVTSWFSFEENNNSVVDDLRATVETISDDHKSITISIEGSFNSAISTTQKNGTIKINPNYIKNAKFTDPIVINTLKYRVNQVLSYDIAMPEVDDADSTKSKDYRGSQTHPLVAIPNESVNSLVRINLTNGVFKSGLSNTNVAKWFSALNGIVISGLKCEITDGGSEVDYVEINITGTGLASSGSSELTGISRLLSIPVSDVRFGETSKDYTITSKSFYYVKTNDVQVRIADGTGYYGSSSVRPVEFVPNYKIGNDGNGVVVRLILTNKTFKQVVLEGFYDQRLSAMFANLGGDDAVGSSNLSYKVQTATSTQNVLDIVISGYTTKDKPVEGSVDVTIPYDFIQGAIQAQGDKTVKLYYKVNEAASVTLDSEYVGESASSPLIFPRYITNGDGNGQKVKINLSNGVKFASTIAGNDSTTNTIIKNWIQPTTATNVTITKAEFDAISEDRTTLIINVEGYATNSSTGTRESSVELRIRNIDLANYYLSSNDNKYIKTSMYFKRGNEPTFTIVNTSLGSSHNYAIQATPYINIGDTGEGVDVTIQVTDAQNWSAFKFASTLSDAEVTKWFNTKPTGVNDNTFVTQFGGAPTFKYISGAGTDTVKIRISGYISSPSKTITTILGIPMTSVLGGVNTNSYIGKSSAFYFYTLATPTLTFDNTSIYYGADTNRALYLPSLGQYFMGRNDSDTDYELGIPVKVSLSEGKFRSDITAEDIENWTDFTAAKIVKEDNNTRWIHNINLSNDQKTITFRIRGTLNTENDTFSDDRELVFTVPFTDIVNASENTTWQNANLKKSLKYRSLGNVHVISVDDTVRDYSGTATNPISNPEYTYFNNSNGTKVRLLLGTGYGYNGYETARIPSYARIYSREFDSSISGNNVKDWFTLGTSAENDINIDSITIESVADDGSYIDLLIKGYLKGFGKEGFMGQSIPASAFKNVSSSASVVHGTANKTTGAYTLAGNDNVVKYSNTKDNGNIVAKVSTDTGFVGGNADNALHGTPYTNFGQGNLSNKIKIQLTNAKFNNTLTNAVVTSWFEPLTTQTEGTITYTIESGTGANFDNVIINVNGYPTRGGLNNNFDISIPYSVLSNVDKTFTALPLNVYYLTDATETIELDPDAPYSGTSGNPIQGTPYIKLFHSETSGQTTLDVDGVKVKIDLKGTSKTFSNSVTSARVKEWFKNFEDGVGGRDFEYKLYDATGKEITSAEDKQSIIVEINGYPTTPNKIVTSNIAITYNDIKGAVQSFGTKNIPLYFQTSGKVVATIENTLTDYYGSDGTPLESAAYVAYGEDKDNGLKVRINLQNAKFNNTHLTTLLNKDISSIVNDAELSTRKYTLIELDTANASYIDLKVTGYTANSSYSSSGDGYYKPVVTLPVDYILHASSVLTGTANGVYTTLYYRSLGSVTATLSPSSGFVGSTNTPLSGTPYINVGDGEGVKVRILLQNAKFNEGLTNAMLAEMFSDFTKAYGTFTYEMVTADTDPSEPGTPGGEEGGGTTPSEPSTSTSDVGGPNSTYVDVIIKGYPTLRADQKNLSTNINIKYKHLKTTYPRANATEDSTMVTTLINYETESAVSAKITNAVGLGMSAIAPLGQNEYKYMQFNNGNGIRVRIELQNAKFSSSMNYTEFATALAKAINDSTFNTAFKNITCTFEDEIGRGTDTITVMVSGYAYKEVALSTEVPIYIPYNFIENGGPQEQTGTPLDNALKLRINGAAYNTSGLEASRLVKVVPNASYSGSSQKAIVATRYMKVGVQGNGATITLELTGATFGGDLVQYIAGGTAEDETATETSVNTAINTWLTPLTTALGGTVSYEWVKNSVGTGMHTNRLAIKMIGAPNPTVAIGNNKSVQITIPFSALDNTGTTTNEAGTALNLTTSLYYNVTNDVRVEVSAASGYVGSENSPLTGTPYISIGGNDGSVKVMLSVINPTGSAYTPVFASGITSDNIRSWFAPLNNLQTADSQRINYYNLTYSIEGGTTTTTRSSIIVNISGYPQQADIVKASVNIAVPIDKLDNTDYAKTDSTGATVTMPTIPSPFYYSASGSVSITGANLTFKAYEDVYFGDGDGQEITLTIKNAKFKDLDKKDFVTTWFSDIATQEMNLSSVTEGSSSNRVRGVKLVSEKETTGADGVLTYEVKLLVQGYLKNTSTTDHTAALNILSSDITNSVVGLTLTSLPNLQIQCTGSYNLEGKAPNASTRFAFTLTKNVYIGENQTDGVTFEISNNISYFKDSLTIDDVKNWFSAFTTAYDPQTIKNIIYKITINKTGNKVDKVTVNITGYPSNFTTYTTNMITIPENDMKASNGSKPVLITVTAVDSPQITISNKAENTNGIEIKKDEVVFDIPTAERRGYYFNVKLERAVFTSIPTSGVEVTTVHDVANATDDTRNNTMSAKYYLVPTSGSTTEGKIYIVGRVNASLDAKNTITTFVPRFTFNNSHIKNLRTNYNLSNARGGEGLITDGSIYTTVTPYYYEILSNTTGDDNRDIAFKIPVNGDTSYSGFVSSNDRHPFPSSQQINFYVLQGGMNWPISTSATAEVPFDFAVADIQVTGGFWKVITTWATSSATNKYDFNVGGTAHETYYGVRYTNGTKTNRNSATDPAAIPSLYEMILFCNAATEWYNSEILKQSDTPLTPVYVDASGAVIRSISSTTNNYVLSTIGPNHNTYLTTGAGKDKTGFRLPLESEYCYAASVSEASITASSASFTPQSLLPSGFYAQSYNAPSGYTSVVSSSDTIATHPTLKDYVIYYGLYSTAGEEAGTQPVGKYVKTDATRTNGAKQNYLGLYDMSGNLNEQLLGNTKTDGYWNRGVAGSYTLGQGVSSSNFAVFNINELVNGSKSISYGDSKYTTGLRLYRTLPRK